MKVLSFDELIQFLSYEQLRDGQNLFIFIIIYDFWLFFIFIIFFLINFNPFIIPCIAAMATKAKVRWEV